MQLIKNKNRARMIEAATDHLSCDISIENAKLVNVITGEIYTASVDILDGCIVRVRMEGEERMLKSEKIIDANGAYLLPGFIDTHMHVESSLLVPENFGKAAALWGTTTAITDPHEIANVFGIKGVKYMLDSAKRSPIRLYSLAPSCVPSLPGFETAGAVFMAPEIEELLQEEHVIGIAEVMDYVGVVNNEARMHEILEAGLKKDVFIQGHAPMCKGAELCGYMAAGPVSDHECVDGEELLAKRRMGMFIDCRVHSLDEAKELMKGITKGIYSDTVSLCTDDVNAYRLQRLGHLNRCVADLILAGMNPMDVIRMATYNAAREYHFSDVGAIIPGYAADLQLVKDLSFEDYPIMVLVEGKIVAENGKLQSESAGKAWYGLGNSIDINLADTSDFMIPCSTSFTEAIVVNEGYERDTIVRERLLVDDGYAYLSEEQKGEFDFIGVFNRYGSGGKTIALIKGFGLKAGAIASSIGHDCHNICVIYANPSDAYLAVKTLKECGGGVCYVRDGKVQALLKLPVAGLMSDLPLDETAAQCKAVEELIARDCGLKSFSLSNMIFHTLPVMIRYTPTDMGIVDGPRKKFVF